MIEAHHENGAYFVMLRTPNAENPIVTMKFDSGAINTVISVEALTAKTIDKDQLVGNIKGKAARKMFRSASGNKMEGYLVCATDVVLSGKVFDEFYYYLLVDVDDSVGLLGDDFISKCEFSHKIDGNIEITAFDDVHYKGTVGNCISESTLDQLLGLCEA